MVYPLLTYRIHLNYLYSHKTKRCLRNSYRIYIPFVRTTMAKTSFYYQGAVLWNSLDQSLYSSTTLATFKSRYSSLYFP